MHYGKQRIFFVASGRFCYDRPQTEWAIIAVDVDKIKALEEMKEISCSIGKGLSQKRQQK